MGNKTGGGAFGLVFPRSAPCPSLSAPPGSGASHLPKKKSRPSQIPARPSFPHFFSDNRIWDPANPKSYSFLLVRSSWITIFYGILGICLFFPNQTLTKCLFSVGFLTGAKRRDLSPSIGFFWGSSLGKKLGRDLSPSIGFLEFFIRGKNQEGICPKYSIFGIPH